MEADAQLAPAPTTLDPEDASISAAQNGPPRHPSPSPITSNQVTQAQTSAVNSRNGSPMPLIDDDAHNRSSHPSSTATSIKGEESTDAPYGTRSRIRPGPRPNYSEDLDLNFEAGSAKGGSAAQKRAKQTESSSTPQPTTELSLATTAMATVGAQPRGFTPANRNRLQANGASAAVSAGSSATPPAEAAQSRQKRKFTYKAGTESSPTVDLNGDPIPGTSQFSTNSSTSDQPSKRRKTAEHVTSAPANSSIVPAAPRRTGSHGGKNLARESCIVTFEKTGAVRKNGKLIADDGTAYCIDDNVYLVCEPPGDPYYLCRIMEFKTDDPNDPKAPVTYMLVNWFYRPKDIGRFSVDSRMLYASMQSDEVPLTAMRGKCTIKHRSEMGPNAADLDEYKRQRDSFWFSELYDRYIHRPYNMVPAKAVINVPKHVKKAIDERWKFLIVEQTRMKELTSAVKLCKRCDGYCAPHDSVDCGVCQNTYHMTCVNPPLARKPARGFAWSCGPCSQAQEKKLEARHASNLTQESMDGDEDMVGEDKASGTVSPEELPEFTEKAVTPAIIPNQAEVDKARLWPWRYLGIHCNVEDVLQYDDRAIYPRASSRLGARHQAIVEPWFGRSVEFVPPLDIKKKYAKSGSHKKDAKYSKETLAAIEADKLERAKRPGWIQDEPPGYSARGEDYDESDERCTATRVFIAPSDTPSSKNSSLGSSHSENIREQRTDDYLQRAKQLAIQRGYTRPISVGLKTDSTDAPISIPTNYLDRTLSVLYKHDFDADAALEDLRQIRAMRDFGEPEFSQEELKKFREGVVKFGSELRLVKRHVKTKLYGDIVRFYYIWKKTSQGMEIWGKHDARRGSKKRTETSWLDIADEEDDSAFDMAKSHQRKRRFQCKFCLSTTSRQWRRAPGVVPGAIALIDSKASAKDKANQLVVALCQRCAYPWRRYSIRWEDPEEVAKSLTAPGGRQWKRLQDEMMLRELVLANEAAQIPTTGITAAAAASIGITLTVPIPEPALASKKKAVIEKDGTSTPTSIDPGRKKAPVPAPPRPPTPPLEPDQPTMRDLPCAVCCDYGNVEYLVTCSSCRLTVHRHCYGVPTEANGTKWNCDTCANDKNNMYSLDHRCVLCTVHERTMEHVTQPKASHKRTSPREKEKHALEKQLAEELATKYKREQIAKGRPPYPREALKHTTSNNWVHLICAIWTPEIKFGKASELDEVDGIGAVMSNPARLTPLCHVCRVPESGTTVPCHDDKCSHSFHVACAQEAGYRLGFDIKPVKGAKKDALPTLAFGNESGLMTAVIYCNAHAAATTPILHRIDEVNGNGEIALEAFVRTYKQADTTLTGTARKANMLTQSTKAAASASKAAAAISDRRRTSTNPQARRSSIVSNTEEVEGPPEVSSPEQPELLECSTCGNDISFRWWPVSDRRVKAEASPDNGLTNGKLAGVDTRSLIQCHSCHIRESEGIVPTPPHTDDDSDEESQPADSNFFTLTMAPPPPPHPEPQSTLGQPQQPYTNGWHDRADPASNSIIPTHSREIIENMNPEVERWTRELWASQITLAFPWHQALHYAGHEFGSLNDPPSVPWGNLERKARRDRGFDNQRHVIISQNGTAIEDENSMVIALASIINTGASQVHWNVQHRGPPPPSRHQESSTQSPPGPQASNGLPSSSGASYSAAAPAYSGSHSQQPQLTGPPPQINGNHAHGRYPSYIMPPPRSGSTVSDMRSGSMTSSAHQSPLLTQTFPSGPPSLRQPTPHETSNLAPEPRSETPTINGRHNEHSRPSVPLQSPAAAHAPVPSQTPNGLHPPEQARPAANGARTSPNVRNLMH